MKVTVELEGCKPVEYYIKEDDGEALVWRYIPTKYGPVANVTPDVVCEWYPDDPELTVSRALEWLSAFARPDGEARSIFEKVRHGRAEEGQLSILDEDRDTALVQSAYELLNIEETTA